MRVFADRAGCGRAGGTGLPRIEQVASSLELGWLTRMKPVAEASTEQLKPLIGLRLTIARRAADLRNFQFGQIRAVERGTVGEYALHIQCPWRLEGPAGILTGSSDLWEPAEASEQVGWDSWHYERNGNLQDRQIGALLGRYDAATRSFVNQTEHLVVEEVRADNCGGLTIQLSGGYRLVLFPAGIRGEDWRIFRPDTDDPHFVVAGGRVESAEQLDERGASADRPRE
jgi:hypothetical protein